MQARSQLPLLIQPASGGRLSGGYLYNHLMAAEGAWSLLEATPDTLAQALERVTARVVLADSLWLNATHLPCFLRLKDRGIRVGMVLHAFPSIIRAADSGRPVPVEANAFELAALSALDLVVVLGEYHRAQLVHAGANVVMCPPGVSASFRGKPKPRAEYCRFVSLSALTPVKGLADVADIFGTWGAKPRFEWTAIGNTTADAHYAQRVCRQIEGKSHLKLLGQLQPEAVADELLQADVLVLPSYSENHPLVVLEALAAAVPVVAYAVGAVPHLVASPKRGLTAAVGDKLTLSQHLRMLCQDEARRFAMAQACYEYQATIPDWQTAARNALSALYRSHVRA